VLAAFSGERQSVLGRPARQVYGVRLTSGMAMLQAPFPEAVVIGRCRTISTTKKGFIRQVEPMGREEGCWRQVAASSAGAARSGSRHSLRRWSVEEDAAQRMNLAGRVVEQAALPTRGKYRRRGIFRLAAVSSCSPRAAGL
jgi:hypothetical protein